MSERQAKKMRKEAPEVQVAKKPKNTQKVVFNLISVIIIVVVAGLAGYSIWKNSNPTSAPETFEETLLANYEMDFATAAEKWNLDTTLFTPGMDVQEASLLFTLENFAKMSDQEPAEFLEAMKIDAETPTNVPCKDLSTRVMMLSNGLDIELDLLRAYGLPEEITDETPWGESNEAIFAALNGYYTAMSQAAQAEAEAEGETEAETEAETNAAEEAETNAVETETETETTDTEGEE